MQVPDSKGFFRSITPQGDGNEENDEVRSRNDELKAARSQSPLRYPFCLPIHHSSFIIHHSSFIIHHSSLSSITPQGDGNEENDEVRSRNDELKAARSQSPLRYPFCLPIHHSSFIIHHSLPLPREGTETKRMMKSEVGMMN